MRELRTLPFTTTTTVEPTEITASTQKEVTLASTTNKPQWIHLPITAPTPPLQKKKTVKELWAEHKKKAV